MVSSATPLDSELSVKKEYIRIEGDKSIFQKYLARCRCSSYLEHGTL